MIRLVLITLWLLLSSCALKPRAPALPGDGGPDTVAIARLARDLADDSLRGRGPWTRENLTAAQMIAARLQQLGALPAVGQSLLVPFVTAPRLSDTAYNVVGILPSRNGSINGQLVGVTAHLDHLGVGRPDGRGDSIYNGFTDDAIGVAMSLDVARRYRAAPGDRPLLVAFFNLEEQGLLGSIAFTDRQDLAPLLARIQLLVGIDAGTPMGEPLTWQLMGGAPEHAGTRLADSLARSRGWTTTTTTARAISDVYPFARHEVPILFPIGGKPWKGYTEAQLAATVKEFDHYHQPADQWRPDFPLTGTWHLADWVYQILHLAADSSRVLR